MQPVNVDLTLSLIQTATHWRDPLAQVPARAIENLSYMAAANIVGTDGNGVACSGGSVPLDPQGHSLVKAGDQSGVFSATLSIDQLKTYRQTFPAWQDADEFSLDV